MVYEKLVDILVGQLGVDEDSITPETNIMDDLGLDSLDVAEMISTVEDEFHIMIRDERIRNVVTVREICDFIESQL